MSNWFLEKIFILADEKHFASKAFYTSTSMLLLHFNCIIGQIR